MMNTLHPYNGLRAGYNQAKDSAALLFKPLDPKKEKEFRETKAVLQQTLSAMKNSKNTLAQQQKAMAHQKVIRLKEALKNLKQMGFMDPKAVARMTARLARELASAIKEYASAGATYSEISTAGSGTDNHVTATPADNSKEQQAETVETQHVVPETEPMQNGMKQAASASNPNPDPNPFHAYEKTQNFGQTKDRNENGTIRKKDDDSPFMKDAKEILEELRNLVKTRRHKSGLKALFGLGRASDHEKSAYEAEKSHSEAEKLLREADRAFTSLTRNL